MLIKLLFGDKQVTLHHVQMFFLTSTVSKPTSNNSIKVHRAKNTTAAKALQHISLANSLISLKHSNRGLHKAEYKSQSHE